MSSSLVAIVATDDAQRDHSLAAQLSLPLVSSTEGLPNGCTTYLSYCGDYPQENRLQLFPIDAKQSGPVCVDFASNAAAHRLQSGGELIVKAVKGRSKEMLRVVDATAGLGRDSFVLAAYGFDVVAIERNAIVAALLNDGLQRALQSPVADIAARIHLVQIDALTYFKNIAVDQPLFLEQQPDVIYLDPMFVSKDKLAHAEKSALVKKEMRLFRQLLGDDIGDEAELLSAARATAKLRVVVKRAIKAEYLAGIQPGYALTGKAIRFDVYPS
ncbi:MAG: class I SAM-dependent methyltransferase [Spongiibacteraceae bacterium]